MSDTHIKYDTHDEAFRHARGWLDIGYAAEAAGVTRDAVASWVKRTMGRHALRLQDNRIHITYRATERYLSSTKFPRVAEKPYGWVTLKGILDEAGVSRSTMMVWLAQNTVRCVTFKAGVYIHPDDAKYAIQSFKGLKPPPGFISLTDLCKEIQRSRIFALRIRKRLNIPAYEFREPGKRRQAYLSPAGAKALRDYSDSSYRRKDAGATSYRTSDDSGA